MKRRINKYVLLLTLLFITLAFSSIATAKKEKQKDIEQLPSLQLLPETLASLIRKYKIDSDNISFYVKDLNEGKTLLDYNSAKQRSPASTMKLLTTYAALKLLKPSYRWRTEAWTRGNIEKETLKGDLILKGYGDPFLVQEKYWKFIQGIREKGLKHITGHIIIDNSYFKLPPMNSGSFDNEPYRLYNAIPSALMYNYQATRFLFRPDKKNEKIEVIPYPKVADITYRNQVTYDKTSCKRKHYRPSFQKQNNMITIKGTYSAKCGQQFILRTISDPEQHAYNGFIALWQDMGGNSGKGLQRGKVKVNEKDILFHTYTSDSLGEQIRTINKWSNNVMTRQLLLTLGAKKYGQPATLNKGRAAILATLSENGIDNNGIIIDNGSGLSRIARITTTQHAELLEKAWKDEFMPEFLSSLSLAGLDGTLVNKFRENKDMRGRSHMKTGTLKDVKSLAGYMLNRKDKWLLVVIHHNGPKIGAGRGSRIQDALLHWAFEQ